MEDNPLLDFSGLPRFGEIRPEHIAPAIERLLEENRSRVAALGGAHSAPSWDGFVQPLEDANERLARAWGVAAHLHAVDDGAQIRDAYNSSLPKVTRYWSALAQDLALYRKYGTLRASAEFPALSPAQQRIIDNELRDFRLGGAELDGEAKRRFAAIQDELAVLAAKFSENLLDATNAFSVVVDSPAEVAGIPEDVLQAARAEAAADGAAGWKFTLHAPSYVPLMQYAVHRPLRQAMYRAYVTRASEFGPPALDNSALIDRMIALRHEAATLLGFRNHAEVSLAAKMADSPQAVISFLESLADRALPFARRDWAELCQFAREELALETVEPCDVAWVSERLRQRRYAFSDHEVKQYFPEHKVLAGMFGAVGALYGVRVEPASARAWHPDVRYLRLLDADGEEIGSFYLDLYSRPTKRGGAWMDEARNRRRRDGTLQTPVAYLVCNFPRPAAGEDGRERPALFTHDEVMTLFHEFGHGLHHLLSRVDHLGASGLHGVEWDAVELPSQFMENYCWEWQVLRQLTAHADSGEALPRALFERMIAAKNFQAGMQMVRQIEFALFDMHLHFDFESGAGDTPRALLQRIREQVAVVKPPEWERFPNGFSHIFGGGYSAGYYSYKWAEVLSADAYSLFEEKGVLDPGTGARFRDEILAVGGSRPAMDSFLAFRGRGPNVDALLRHNGMAPASRAAT